MRATLHDTSGDLTQRCETCQDADSFFMAKSPATEKKPSKLSLQPQKVLPDDSNVSFEDEEEEEYSDYSLLRMPNVNFQTIAENWMDRQEKNELENFKRALQK